MHSRSREAIPVSLYTRQDQLFSRDPSPAALHAPLLLEAQRAAAPSCSVCLDVWPRLCGLLYSISLVPFLFLVTLFLQLLLVNVSSCHAVLITLQVAVILPCDSIRFVFTETPEWPVRGTR